MPPPYDCEHEKNRKEQLIKLFLRTPEEVEEEEMLVAELKKIEGRKKEREKKSQDINKLITAAENKPTSASLTELGALPGFPDPQNIKKEKKAGKKSKKRRPDPPGEKSKDQPGIKFPEIKGSGVFLRSSRLKMPPSVGNKKSKAVEQLLDELGVDLFPMPTEEICQNFNELRNQLLLLYELKQAMGNCEYELHTMKHQYELTCPGKKVSDLIGFSLNPPEQPDTDNSSVTATSSATSSVPASSTATSEVSSGSGLLIDAVASIQPIGSRKRRTASTLLDSSSWKKTKKV